MVSRRRRPRVRTDRTSLEVQSPGGFTTSVKWGNALDVREFSKVTFFFQPTFIATGATFVQIAVQWSDDGTTIPFGDDHIQQSDFNLPQFADGSFRPKDYVYELSIEDGTLIVGATPPDDFFTVPVGGAFCRVGVRSDVAGGTYGVRAQRLVL